MLEPIARELRVSLPELLSGEPVINGNRSANILRSCLYVCPICGNVLHATGSAMISCCGVTLPPLEAEPADAEHEMSCAVIEDEYFVSLHHPMTKTHSISFLAYCTSNRFEVVKLYPEGSAEARFFKRGHGILYWYCNHHGLFSQRI
jgi:desulfoferrodoxin (superoxide reductase-like protein)